MTRSWISDTPDEVEHPPVPLGINEMAVPRVTLMLSLGTALVMLLSAIWVGWAAWNFSADLEDSFGPPVEAPTIDGRLAWEVDLLFDTCSAREGDWEWPENLSGQDDVFLYPGELRCDWGHQGDGDRASLVVYNRGNTTVDLVLEIRGAGVLFSDSDDTSDLMTLDGNQSGFAELELTDDITEGSFTVVVSHLTVVDAEVLLDVNVFKGTEEREMHINDNDRIEVHYVVWDADTGEQLDEGDLLVTAGDDPAYIDGFGWSAIGLDIDGDRGLIPGIDTGTSHTTLLPPPIAYGNSDGHELQDSWLRFELSINRGPIT
ncbi:MAG: hypothetical protein QF709_01490 [Candidatus Thalassarchaeum sp.]|nr:hypothetical protein [Candidatus Thalassarchaeum sp.]MDP6920574.1 hypothetical protein [Candidatus Thalassarchaeum sp.]